MEEALKNKNDDIVLILSSIRKFNFANVPINPRKRDNSKRSKKCVKKSSSAIKCRKVNDNDTTDKSMKTNNINQTQETLKQTKITSSCSIQNKDPFKKETMKSTNVRNNVKIIIESTQIHTEKEQNKLSQDSNQELEMTMKIRNRIHQISQSNEDIIIITRYLRTILFDDKTDSKIKQFEIPNKNSQTGILGNFLDKIIVLKKNLTILSYSIIKNDDYIVHYYNKKDLIKKLPLFLNVQIKPSINSSFYIVVICDQSELNSNFDINKNCFQIAISSAKDDIDDMKNRIIKYLKLPSSFQKPAIYTFKKPTNSFVKISSLDEIEIESTNKPFFTAWEHSIFIQVKSLIESHMIKDHI